MTKLDCKKCVVGPMCLPGGMETAAKGFWRCFRCDTLFRVYYQEARPVKREDVCLRVVNAVVATFMCSRCRSSGGSYLGRSNVR